MSDHAHSVPAAPTPSGLKQPYYLPNPSPWPIMGALGGGVTMAGIVLAMHYGTYYVLILGALIIFATMFLWWRDVIREAGTPGLIGPIVRLGLRYGMTLFIASEVMFFVGFF